MVEKEQMSIVVVGHVDHGKSTVIGRLLADTRSLPEGKLEAVRSKCARESKTFEYAFLLDALSDEQDQGITIDSARCFFQTQKRDYIIIDAPGHIEFLKNMISGAARAEAAVLVIDADEGVQENSKRHGYMLSMLGIKQVIVCVNKMDLVDYKKDVFDSISFEYSEFLKEIGISAKMFLPISALQGENMISASEKMPWFNGQDILSALDSFEKQPSKEDKPFRMPVQDVYKFTGKGDSRRIIAGRVESGTVSIGDKVIFLPSNKQSVVKSIESFNTLPADTLSVGASTGVTLTEQIYVNRGDVMCKVSEPLPLVSSRFKANLFWMGKNPLRMDKDYFIKIGTMKVPVKLKRVIKVLDASDLSAETKDIVERHEVAECVFSSVSPIAFDTFGDMSATGRFVIVDDYEIRGGGIILESLDDEQAKVREQVFEREMRWERGEISQRERATRYAQKPLLVMITGDTGIDKKSIAKQVEKLLFDSGRVVYFLGIGNLLRGLDADIEKQKREEHVRRLGEVSHILLDAGMMVIATASDLRESELKLLKEVSGKDSVVIANVGNGGLDSRLIDVNLNEGDGIKINALKVIDLLRFRKTFFSM